jgi:preprotein translocase subunit YajC
VWGEIVIAAGNLVVTQGGFIGTVREIVGETAWVEFPKRGNLNRIEPYKLVSLARYRGEAA